ncbi:hypothetical protein IWQ60_000443 [Tieghemiomyces parasiticus]|uniref:Uncharacterized protein n=1 Tax=Tieghemiomyces parasiticus TaxID=78921 RepID=A0A9W8E2U0_9FUNG|nr:hypothetical protein IWQ60_000443 [Tieghemiomyces parasiticus]
MVAPVETLRPTMSTTSVPYPPTRHQPLSVEAPVRPVAPAVVLAVPTASDSAAADPASPLSRSAPTTRPPSTAQPTPRVPLVARPSVRKLATSPIPLSASSRTVDKLKEQQRLSRQRSVRRSRDADFYARIEDTLNHKERDPREVLDHLRQTHPKSELGTLLARKDGFHEALLQTYMSTLDFTGQPLDLALRKLLGELHLPKESQQIDRIIHGFAKRYHESNPELFDSADAVYSLAFSLMLLHTDAHNIHVKHKMTKEQYIKMTRGMDTDCRVPNEVLDILYDNITHLQFFYADQIDRAAGPTLQPPTAPSVGATATALHTQRPSTSSSLSSASTADALGRATDVHRTGSVSSPQLIPDGPAPLSRTQSQSSATSGFSWVKKKLLGRSQSTSLPNRPVALMQQVTTAMLSPKLGPYSPNQSPYSYHGSQSILRDAIMKGVFKMNVPLMRPNRLAVGGRGSAPLAIANHAANEKPTPSVTVLRCAKEGFLVRKVDILENGKRAPMRGWKDFWVVLSGSQLVLFRNIDWFQNPKNRMPPGQRADPGAEGEGDEGDGTGGASFLSTSSSSFALNPFSFSRGDQSVKYASPPPKPHTVIPTVNGVCVLDSDYTKYPYVFRFVAGDGRQYLFRASSDDDVDDWMAKINYAAAFKTLAVATRGAATPTITVDSDQWGNFHDSVDLGAAYHRTPTSAASAIHLPSQMSSHATGSLRGPLPSAAGGYTPGAGSFRKPSPMAYNHLSFSPPASPPIGGGPTPHPASSTVTAPVNPPPPMASPDPAQAVESILAADRSLSRNVKGTSPLKGGDGPVGTTAAAVVSPGSSLCPRPGSAPAVIVVSTATSPRLSRAATAPSIPSPPPIDQPGSLPRRSGGEIGYPPSSLPPHPTATRSCGRNSYDALRDRIAFLSRREILKGKIVELEDRIAVLKQRLQEDLRLHQQLAIMVPFQKTTRQRATIVLDNLRSQIKKQYLNLQKFECYREILETDLEIEIELERGDWE